MLTMTLSAHGWSWRNMCSWIYTPRDTVTSTQQYPLNLNALIDLQLATGDVVIECWQQPAISIAVVQKGTSEQLAQTTAQRTATPGRFAIETTVPDKIDPAEMIYTIKAPSTASIRVSTRKGKITVMDSEHAVDARSENGCIKIRLKKFSSESTVFAETQSGNIKLFVPKKIQAQLRAKTLSGTVTSTIPVALEFTEPMYLNKTTWNMFKRKVQGLLGAGGGSITLETARGNIDIQGTEVARSR